MHVNCTCIVQLTKLSKKKIPGKMAALTNDAGKFGFPYVIEEKTRSVSLTLHHKINAECMKDFKVRPEMLELLEENR